jgi:hypothetical protein
MPTCLSGLNVTDQRTTQSSYGFWLERLFFDAQGTTRGVEFNHAETLRIGHVIAEDGGAVFLTASGAQVVRKMLTVKDVVAEYQAARVLADDEGLRANSIT